MCGRGPSRDNYQFPSLPVQYHNEVLYSIRSVCSSFLIPVHVLSLSLSLSLSLPLSLPLSLSVPTSGFFFSLLSSLVLVYVIKHPMFLNFFWNRRLIYQFRKSRLATIHCFESLYGTPFILSQYSLFLTLPIPVTSVITFFHRSLFFFYPVDAFLRCLYLYDSTSASPTAFMINSTLLLLPVFHLKML